MLRASPLKPTRDSVPRPCKPLKRLDLNFKYLKACPKSIIEIRPQGKKSRRIYVQCVNKDKGAVARKACTVVCSGCGKFVKGGPFEAITLENNLAYICLLYTSHTYHLLHKEAD